MKSFRYNTILIYSFAHIIYNLSIYFNLFFDISIIIIVCLFSYLLKLHKIKIFFFKSKTISIQFIKQYMNCNLLKFIKFFIQKFLNCSYIFIIFKYIYCVL